jgi:hypothetical protein
MMLDASRIIPFGPRLQDPVPTVNRHGIVLNLPPADPAVAAVIIAFDLKFCLGSIIEACRYLADKSVHFISTEPDPHYDHGADEAGNNVVFPGDYMCLKRGY